MKKLLMLAALAALFVGCSVTKIEYEKDDGKTTYRLYRNDHWLKTDASGIQGGMTTDGRFEFTAEGLKSSPSEEFNRTMQTYTTAFVQLAQIAAAAYNPSASRAAAGSESAKNGTDSQPSTQNPQLSTAACADGSCEDKE